MHKAITQNDLDRTLNVALDNLTLKLFRYFDIKFQTIDERFDHQDERIDGLFGLVDVLAKQTEIYHQEMLARDYQFERLEKWIHQIAQKIGITLEY